MLSSRRVLIGICCAALLVSLPTAGQFGGGRTEFRSLNTAIYEISVQKNGRLSATLSNGVPVFENAFPLAQIEGKKRPLELEIDGRQSQRREVRDPLGEGQGMVLRKDDCEWSIRAYPTQPFFAIQVSYLNDGRRPVKISRLMPFCIGDPKKGMITLGPDTDQTVALVDPLSANPQLLQGDVESAHHLALSVPNSNRSLVMGFLTRDQSETRFTLRRTPKADEFEIDYLRAECIYDPPVEVAPGERLDSEVLYIGIGEPSALMGLQRLARATAVTNGLRRTGKNGLHGFALNGERVNEVDALETLEGMAQGWTQLGLRSMTLGPEWCTVPGNWMADADRFPNGLKPVFDRASQLGIEVGLTLTPFQVSPASELAQQRPDWLLPDSGNELRTLDPRAPGVLLYLGSMFRAMRQDWGVSYFVGGDIEAFDRAVPEGGDKTHGLLMREVGNTITDAVGEKGRYIAAASPWAAYNAHGVFHSKFSGSTWQDGVVEVLPDLAKQFYATPFMWENPFTTTSLANNTQLSNEQKLAWLTGLSLMRASIQLTDAPNQLTPTERLMLQRTLPVPERPAQPMDLFVGSRARVWSLTLEGDTGTGTLLAVFNWNENAEEAISVPMDRLGMDASEYYTVYDSWGEQYFGTARGTLQMEVPASSVRVIGLRPFRERPMFLAADSHYSQGATDVENVKWDSGNLTLSGTLEAVAGRHYTFTLLAPERYVVESAKLNSEPATVNRNERVISMNFKAEHPGIAAWSVTFRTE